MQIWEQAKRGTTKTPEHAGGGTRRGEPADGCQLSAGASVEGLQVEMTEGRGGYSVCHVHGGLQNLQRFACLAQRPLPLLLSMCVHLAVLC